MIGTTKTTTNLWGERWAKLGVNCMANSVAGFTGLSSAELRLAPEVRRLTIRIAAEVVRVADAHGVAVEPLNGVHARLFMEAMSDGAAMEEVETGLLAGVGQIGGGRPSLAQDIAKGRMIEIDYLNGHVVGKGRGAWHAYSSERGGDEAHAACGGRRDRSVCRERGVARGGVREGRGCGGGQRLTRRDLEQA